MNTVAVAAQKDQRRAETNAVCPSVEQRANRWVVQLAGGDLWRFIAQCIARDGP